MNDDTEHHIRERAYALWEKEGSPHGRDAEFWERARLMTEADAVPPRARPPQSAEDAEIDQAMKDTFPASDPPAFTADHGVLKR